MYIDGLKRENVEKLDKSISECTVKCKCGHSVIITNKVEKVLCRYCGRYVFRSKENEFKYRLKEMLNRVKDKR